MTEIDGKKSSNPTKQAFAKGWARGIFKVALIESLTIGDNRATKSALVSGHDVGFPVQNIENALVGGQGYRVKWGQIERPVPEGQSQVASLDISEDMAVHTEEFRTPL